MPIPLSTSHPLDPFEAAPPPLPFWLSPQDMEMDWALVPSQGPGPSQVRTPRHHPAVQGGRGWGQNWGPGRNQ